MRDLKIGSADLRRQPPGIITDRDIVVKCCAEGLNPAVKAGSLAQGTLQWVDVDTDVDQVLRLMKSTRCGGCRCWRTASWSA